MNIDGKNIKEVLALGSKLYFPSLQKNGQIIPNTLEKSTI